MGTQLNDETMITGVAYALRVGMVMHSAPLLRVIIASTAKQTIEQVIDHVLDRKCSKIFVIVTTNIKQAEELQHKC